MISTRYAESDDDVIAIHRFLCVVAMPELRAPVDAKESIEEVWRVVKEECAIMAMNGDLMVGTLGLIKVPWWFNSKFHFMIDRWFYTIGGGENKGIGAALLAEANVVAAMADLDLYIMGKMHKRRRRDLGRGITFVSPKYYPSPSNGGENVLRRIDAVDPDHNPDS